MTKPTRGIVAVALACGIALSMLGCSSTTASENPAQTAQGSGTETREAGVRGTRICFVNETDLVVSIAPADLVYQENADHIIGEKGPIPTGSQVCYAGWNSYQATGWEDPRWADIPTVDVSATIGIDGNYNAIYFRGDNKKYVQAFLAWTTGKPTERGYPGIIREEDNPLSKADSVAGHPFTVTMVEESEYFKEFVVRFTK